MKSERKVYMTIDRNGRPQTFGNSNKFAWKSARWVNYHLRPRWGNTSSFVNHGGQIRIVDLKTNTIENLSAAAFLVRFGNEEDFKAEAKQKIGFSLEPGVLVEMYNAGIFPSDFHEKVGNFLKEKNLI